MNQKIESSGGQNWRCVGGFWRICGGPPAKKSNRTHSPHLTSPLDWPSGSGLNFNGLDSLGGQVLLVFGRVGFELGRPGPPAKKSNITHGPKNPTELAPQPYPALWERLCLQRRFQRAAQLWGASSVIFFGSRALNSRVQIGSSITVSVRRRRQRGRILRQNMPKRHRFCPRKDPNSWRSQLQTTPQTGLPNRPLHHRVCVGATQKWTHFASHWPTTNMPKLAQIAPFLSAGVPNFVAHRAPDHP